MRRSRSTKHVALETHAPPSFDITAWTRERSIGGSNRSKGKVLKGGYGRFSLSPFSRRISRFVPAFLDPDEKGTLSGSDPGLERWKGNLSIVVESMFFYIRFGYPVQLQRIMKPSNTMLNRCSMISSHEETSSSQVMYPSEYARRIDVVRTILPIS